MNTIEIELKKYESYLRLSNFSIRCVRSYVSTLKYFLEYCKEHYNEKSIDQQMVSEYLLMRLNKGLSWSAINCDYSSLRKYFKNVADIEWDLKKLPRPRKEKILPTIFSQEQVQKIIESANTYKQQIFITFLYGTGMRLSEGINVKFEDIDADRLQIKVNKGRGGKDRMVQVPIELVQLLTYVE